jgi:hypothetical protein
MRTFKLLLVTVVVNFTLTSHVMAQTKGPAARLIKPLRAEVTANLTQRVRSLAQPAATSGLRRLTDVKMGRAIRGKGKRVSTSMRKPSRKSLLHIGCSQADTTTPVRFFVDPKNGRLYETGLTENGLAHPTTPSTFLDVAGGRQTADMITRLSRIARGPLDRGLNKQLRRLGTLENRAAFKKWYPGKVPNLSRLDKLLRKGFVLTSKQNPRDTGARSSMFEGASGGRTYQRLVVTPRGKLAIQEKSEFVFGETSWKIVQDNLTFDQAKQHFPNTDLTTMLASHLAGKR